MRSESEAFDAWCQSAGHATQRVRDQVTVEVLGKDKVRPLLAHALDQNVDVVRVMPRSETLEDLFVREAISPKSSGDDENSTNDPDIESS